MSWIKGVKECECCHEIFEWWDYLIDPGTVVVWKGDRSKNVLDVCKMYNRNQYVVTLRCPHCNADQSVEEINVLN